MSFRLRTLLRVALLLLLVPSSSCVLECFLESALSGITVLDPNRRFWDSRKESDRIIVSQQTHQGCFGVRTLCIAHAFVLNSRPFFDPNIRLSPKRVIRTSKKSLKSNRCVEQTRTEKSKLRRCATQGPIPREVKQIKSAVPRVLRVTSNGNGMLGAACQQVHDRAAAARQRQLAPVGPWPLGANTQTD